MRVYISGAITGTNDYMERFNRVEARLSKEGHMVFNPAHANSFMPQGTTYEEYMEISFCLLKMADAIYMIKGWENSKGANREYGYALGKGLKVIYEGGVIDG